jgi:hypothetical protein
MTQKEAIELSIEVWSHLAAHPGIAYKSDLPKKIYGKIENMKARCPLCECIRNILDSCNNCPLCFVKDGNRKRCSSGGHPYTTWRNSNKEGRKEGATAIVRLLEAALEKENSK